MITKRQPGFTIVELLIVIVVIGILAAITIVAYSGIQQRSRDARRLVEIRSIEKALSLYYVDNGGYPTCSNTVYIPGGALSGCNVGTILSSLVPQYLSTMPQDPLNSGSFQYYYAAGFKKTGDSIYVADQSNNFITGAKLEAKGGPYNTGWTGFNDLNYLGGSGY